MKAQLFASAALVLLNAIPGALSAEPQLRGVILATDFENQLDLYDSKDEDLSEDFDFDFEATEPYEEDEFDSSEDYTMEPYEENFYGRGGNHGGGGGGYHYHQGMAGGMPGGGNGGGSGQPYYTPYYNNGGVRGMPGGGNGGGSGQPYYTPYYNDGVPGNGGGSYGHSQYGYGYTSPKVVPSYGRDGEGSGESVDGGCSQYPAEACGSGGGGHCTWSDGVCIRRKSGGSGGNGKRNRARGKKGAVCKSGRKSYAPQDSVCYCLSEIACVNNAYSGCFWNPARRGYCDGGY